METIEIKVEKKTEEVVSINLPAFRKNGFAAYKVISKDECVQVTFGSYVKPRIEQVDSSLAFFLQETQDCTEGEFKSIFDQTMERLIDLSVK